MAASRTSRWWRLDWPLLGKELLEQAARRQMYVTRVAYAVVLFGAFGFYYVRHLAQGPVLIMGGGLEPFNFLVSAQMLTIFLFLPPLMAGALAQEKERDTLGLLFLTDLTPWELILQKYFGRLIPMLSLLFLSLPLLAVAYSLGGVSTDQLFYSAEKLFLTCLWVGALGLECSAHQASTFQALLRCWGLCLGLSMCCLTVPSLFGSITYPVYGPGPGIPWIVVPAAFTGMLYLAMTYVFLVRARQILEERAFVQRRNPFGQQFKHLDQYWKDTRKLVRAILRKRDSEARSLAEQVIRRSTPGGGDPRAWSPVGFLFAKMQVPNVLAGAIIIGTFVVLILVSNMTLDPKSGVGFGIIVFGFWVLAALTIPIQSANAVATERMNERLGPMLTTPLTAHEILDEWLGPVRRWTHFIMGPMALVVLLEAAIKFETQDPGSERWWSVAQYLGLSLMAIVVYPALAQWMCLWIGLRIRNQIRALMTAMLLVAGWCVLPLATGAYLLQTGVLFDDRSQLVFSVSPATVISTAEALGRKSSDTTMHPDALLLAFIQLAVAALITVVIRRRCLTGADRYLGRI